MRIPKKIKGRGRFKKVVLSLGHGVRKAVKNSVPGPSLGEMDGDDRYPGGSKEIYDWLMDRKPQDPETGIYSLWRKKKGGGHGRD